MSNQPALPYILSNETLYSLFQISPKIVAYGSTKSNSPLVHIMTWLQTGHLLNQWWPNAMEHLWFTREIYGRYKKPVRLEHFNILERHDYERNRVNLFAFNYKNYLGYFMKKKFLFWILPTSSLQVHDIFLMWFTVLKFCPEHRAKDSRLTLISGGIVTVPNPSYILSFERKFSLRPRAVQCHSSLKR